MRRLSLLRRVVHPNDRLEGKGFSQWSPSDVICLVTFCLNIDPLFRQECPQLHLRKMAQLHNARKSLNLGVGETPAVPIYQIEFIAGYQIPSPVAPDLPLLKLAIVRSITLADKNAQVKFAFGQHNERGTRQCPS
jgi:hypothetical protein